jgi:hypothetical protein
MKSAYQVLGVAPDAPIDDIRAACTRELRQAALQAETAGALEAAARRAEIRVAWEILSSTERRAAHDRSLWGGSPQQTAAPAPTPEFSLEPVAPPAAALPAAAPPAARPPRTGARPTPVVVDNGPTLPRGLLATLLALALIVGAVWWMNQQRAERARHQAEAEAAETLRREEQERLAQRQREAAEAAEQKARAQAERQAESSERRLRQEASMSALRIQADEARRQADEQRALRQAQDEAWRRQSEERLAEQRRVAEAQRIVEADKRRVRELCMQNYGRPNC